MASFLPNARYKYAHKLIPIIFSPPAAYANGTTNTSSGTSAFSAISTSNIPYAILRSPISSNIITTQDEVGKNVLNHIEKIGGSTSDGVEKLKQRPIAGILKKRSADSIATAILTFEGPGIRFDTRTLSLKCNDEVKIGRCVNRGPAAETVRNSIKIRV